MLNDEWDKLTIFSIKNQYCAMHNFPSLIQKITPYEKSLIKFLVKWKSNEIFC